MREAKIQRKQNANLYVGLFVALLSIISIAIVINSESSSINEQRMHSLETLSSNWDTLVTRIDASDLMPLNRSMPSRLNRGIPWSYYQFVQREYINPPWSNLESAPIIVVEDRFDCVIIGTTAKFIDRLTGETGVVSLESQEEFAVVGSSLAKTLAVKVGKTVHFSDETFDVDISVTHILEPTGTVADEIVFIPYTLLIGDGGLPGSPENVEFSLKTFVHPESENKQAKEFVLRDKCGGLISGFVLFRQTRDYKWSNDVCYKIHRDVTCLAQLPSPGSGESGGMLRRPVE